ncbi:MAG: ATP-binding protein, partial [Blautia sp.]|nr:ATP-binding protein [Blautia sp.]
DRVNSNMVIIGKSGSGKSYATKTILSHLAAENSKIFILDPENEYQKMAENFNGKIIDVGSALQGRLNPFHIITNLEDEEMEESAEQEMEKTEENEFGDDGFKSANNSLNVHLQFLEEFYRQILPGINSDALEYLNNITIHMYEEKGIDQDTDLSSLSPSDYPTFDDLFEKILNDFQTASGDYSKNNLRILLNYVSKFATGGRNSGLWNGEATLSTNENFIVFNFQSLLANKNNTIANAQMLLILKWLDNEIIKNRDYNIKHNANRKIIIVIDEAHVFIDSKFPIALDFMFQLAKRIRKYNGMQIVITQNIKDFVGTEELARKSTAIINASQYSFIFPLAPNDMHDLCKLYEKAGAINESEQEDIINNGRGRAFLITSPSERCCVDIVAGEDIERLFTM